MNSATGWRASTRGFSAFAADDDYIAAPGSLDEAWGSSPGYSVTTNVPDTSTDSSDVVDSPATSSFLGDLFKNVATPVFNSVVQSAVTQYGQPTGYKPGPGGMQIPYWGTAAKPFTINPQTGARVDFPASNKWLIPAIIGGVGLLALVFVMMKKRR